MTRLTPVERSVLVALMAAGRPLRESADLAQGLAISMTASHRKKLQAQELIKTTPSPFTHTLTDAGWAFLAKDFPLDVPREPMKIGGMVALLAGVRERLGSDGDTLKAFFTAAKPKPSARSEGSVSVAQTASHADSDEKLAFALQDMGGLEDRLGRAERVVNGPAVPVMRQVSLSAEALAQSLRAAARDRGLETLHERHAEVDFDPAYYDAGEGLAVGEAARIVKPAIVRASGSGTVLVARGFALPVD